MESGLLTTTKKKKKYHLHSRIWTPYRTLVLTTYVIIQLGTISFEELFLADLLGSIKIGHYEMRSMVGNTPEAVNIKPLKSRLLLHYRETFVGGKAT